MLPIFGFLLYIVAMFIASKVYQLRSGLHDVPLAIIGPSHLLLDTSMHTSPVPESANFTAGEWLLVLGSVACLITLASLWVIFIWVSVAHPWFLDEVYDKCFISTVDTDDAPWSEQQARDPEEDHLIALKEKDATISSQGEEISKLESELRDLQASSTRQLEESKSAAAKKQNSIKADNVALRKTLHELKLSHQAVSIDHGKKLASKEEDLLKFRASSTHQLEEAKSAAAKKQSSIEADNAALRVTLDNLKLSHQAASIDQDRKLASKEEDFLKFRASSTHQLEEAKSAAAKKQSSIEADNVALRATLDELELSHQAASMEQDKKLASKEEDLLKFRASSTRQLEEAKSAAAKKQSSIEADNVALRATLDELELSHQAASMEQDKKLASKEEDLLKFRASSTRQLEEAKSAAAKKQSSIEAENTALRVTLDKLKLSHQAASMEQDKKLASKEEDLLKFRASSTRQLEEAKSAAAKKQSSIEADNAALHVALDELELSHQAANIEQEKKFEWAIQSLHNDHDASILKLQYDLNQHQHLREKSESELAVARAEIAEALKRIHDINLKRSLLRSERDEALAAKSSMVDAFQRLVKENSYLVQSHDKATKALGDKDASIASASNAVVSLRVRLQAQKQKTKEANMKSGLLLKSKDEKIRRLRNEALVMKGEQTMTTKMLKDELDSKNKLLEDKEAEADSFFEAHAAELQRLRMAHAKEMLELEKRGQKKLQDTQDDHSKAMSQAKGDLEKVTKDLERRQTTIEFRVEEAVGSDLQLQLQHHSDYVTRLERWLPNGLASRKEKLTGLRPKEAQEQEELETLYCTENPAYTEELLFAEAGGPNIRLPPKSRAENDSSWSAEEAETRYCTEYLLFAETESPKVRLPNRAQEAPKPVPLPALMDPVGIPLPEDEDLDLLAPEWIPLPEGEDADLLEPEWVPLPEEKDLEFLMPEEIPLPSDEDLDLLPSLPDSEDLDLAPRGPTTTRPTSANKESRAIPPRGAPKAPKAMLAFNARGGPKRGSSSRGSSWSRGGWGSYR